MKQEVNPQETCRAKAFGLWIKSPVPMVTFTKTFDVTRLYKVCKRRGVKFNTLLCWCMGCAATRQQVFYLLPEGEKLYKYDRLAINVIVNHKKGDICSCDVPYSDDFEQFAADYERLTQTAIDTCESSFDEEAMIIGTSAMTVTQLDSIVNQYTGIFTNPFLAWGRYRKSWFKVSLPISMQFHHAQMDGGHAAQYLEDLQQTINHL